MFHREGLFSSSRRERNIHTTFQGMKTTRYLFESESEQLEVEISIKLEYASDEELCNSSDVSDDEIGSLVESNMSAIANTIDEEQAKETSDSNENTSQDETGTSESQKGEMRPVKKEHACTMCYKNFATSRSLKVHISTEHELGRYVCSKCRKIFGRQCDLEIHFMTVHGKLKKLACSVCRKKFGRKGNLDRHILMFHEVKKSYPCPNCNKSFGYKSVLAVHLRSHNGEKPFTCEDCGKSFSQIGSLEGSFKNSRWVKAILLQRM